MPNLDVLKKKLVWISPEKKAVFLWLNESSAAKKFLLPSPPS